MKKSNTSNLLLNLIFVILTAAAMFLIGVAFTEGKEEARIFKTGQEQPH